MAHETDSGKVLAVRKQPSQQRSRKTVDKILEAARRLLKDGSGSRNPRITTHQIAKAAGISVGSLYQYFPNTETIVLHVYRDILDRIPAILDKFDSAGFLSLPRDKFFEKLNRELANAEPDRELVIAMLHVTKKYPVLIEQERKHSEIVAMRIATFLKHFGSSWSIKKLKRLVLYVYYIDHASWMYRDHQDPADREVTEWELLAINSVMMRCFDE